MINLLITSVELGLIYAVVALGVYLSFRIIDFPDLTCDGSMVTGAALCAVLAKAGYNPIIGLALGACAGALAGLLTGLLFAYCRISNLLAGILTAFMLYSINLKIMGGLPNIALLHEPTLFSTLPALPVLVGILLAIALAVGYLLTTDWGLALRSIGLNKLLASAGGLSITGYTLAALMLSNGLVGLGGALLCQHQQFVDLSQGIGTVVIALAAIMIGEKLVPLRSMWAAVGACVLGSVLYRLLVAAALHSDMLGITSADLNLVTGILVVGIMIMSKRNQSC